MLIYDTVVTIKITFIKYIIYAHKIMHQKDAKKTE